MVVAVCSESCLLIVAVCSESCLLIVAVCSESCLLIVAVCSNVTFDHCSECTISDGKYVCKACSSGYTLKDDKSACICK